MTKRYMIAILFSISLIEAQDDKDTKQIAKDLATETAITAKEAQRIAELNAVESKAAIALLSVQLQQARESANSRNTTMMITGGFAFLGLLVPVLLAWQNRITDHQKVLDQIALAQSESHKAAELSYQVKKDIASSLATRTEATEKQNAEIEKIHVLVNSSMTERMKGELSALRTGLAALRDLAAMRVSSGMEVSVTTTDQITSTEGRIEDLLKQLREREANQPSV